MNDTTFKKIENIALTTVFIVGNLALLLIFVKVFLNFFS